MKRTDGQNETRSQNSCRSAVEQCKVNKARKRDREQTDKWGNTKRKRSRVGAGMKNQGELEES